VVMGPWYQHVCTIPTPISLSIRGSWRATMHALRSSAAAPLVHPDRTFARSRRGHPRRPADRSPGPPDAETLPEALATSVFVQTQHDGMALHALEAQDMTKEDIGVRPEVLPVRGEPQGLLSLLLHGMPGASGTKLIPRGTSTPVDGQPHRLPQKGSSPGPGRRGRHLPGDAAR
jgi:hypothetical protein